MPKYATPTISHLAAGALPAAGAWTNQAALILQKGQVGVTAEVTYQWGAASGYPHFKPEWGDGVTEGQGVVVDQAIDTSSAPQGEQAVSLQSLRGPAPPDGAPITYELYSWEVPYGKTRFRLLAAEAGVVGTPGIISIRLSGQVDQ